MQGSLLYARQRGSTLTGLIIGLVLGLALAVVVVVVVTKAPIPFVSRTTHAPDPAATNAPAKPPDPNQSLYSHEAPPAESNTAPPNMAASNSPTPSAVPGVAAVEHAAPPAVNSAPAGSDTRPSYVQAGAYHTQDDAEGMRGRLALLGFDAAVSAADQNGTTLYRVRLGPYNRVDDLNRVRQRLAESGIDASVVPAGKP